MGKALFGLLLKSRVEGKPFLLLTPLTAQEEISRPGNLTFL